MLSGYLLKRLRYACFLLEIQSTSAGQQPAYYTRTRPGRLTSRLTRWGWLLFWTDCKHGRSYTSTVADVHHADGVLISCRGDAAYGDVS
jgi:hypothetical protein